MAEAFELYASFKIDTSGYTQELNKIRQEMEQFQQELNSFAVHPTFDGGRFRTELQQAQQQSTQATEEIKRLQQQIQSLQEAAEDSGDDSKNSITGLLKRIGIVGEIASGQFLGNMFVNGVNTVIDGVTGSISESIELASDLTETQNVVDVTFEDSASTINKWAQEALNAYGITENKAKQYSSTLGAMLKSMGIADDQVLQMSMDMAGLAADMASFYNLDHDTAFEKIRSGISGETEPLKALGINMSVANLNAFALEKGMNKAFDKMSQAEQATLRYQYLLEATKDAQGDFARTGDSFSNEMRKLQTNLDRIKTEFGKGLLGVVTPAISLLNNVLSVQSYQYTDAAKNLIERNESIYEAQATYAQSMTIMNAMRNMEEESGDAIKSTNEWKDALEDLKNVMPGLARYVDLTSDAIVGNTESISKYVDKLNGVSLYAAHEEAVSNAKEQLNQDKQYLAELEAQKRYIQEQIDAAGTETVKAANKAALDSAYAYFKSTVPYYDLADTYDEFVKYSFGHISQRNDIERGRMGNRHSAYEKLNDTQEAAWQALLAAENNYNDPTASLIEKLKELDSQIAETSVSINEETAAFEKLTAEQEEFNKANKEAKLQYDFNKSVDAQKKAFADLKTALGDLETYQADTLAKMEKSYRGLASGLGFMVTHTEAEFDKLVSGKYSEKNVMGWFENNAESLKAYNDALEQAKEAGYDPGILAQIAKYSTENDALLARYLSVADDPEKVKKINAGYQATIAEENRSAQIATDFEMASDEKYQSLVKIAEQYLELYNQSSEITSAMAKNKNAFLGGIDDLKKALEEELPGINELLEKYGFVKIKNDFEKKPWIHDFGGAREGYADMFDDVANDKNAFSKEQAKALHAIEARSRSGYADMIEDGLMPDDIKARAQRWNRLVKMKTQEMNDIVDILEQRMEENQSQREAEEAEQWNNRATKDMPPLYMMDTIIANAAHPKFVPNTYIGTPSSEQQEKTTGGNVFSAIESAIAAAKEIESRTIQEDFVTKSISNALGEMMENYKKSLRNNSAPNIFSNSDGVLFVQVMNPDEIANAVSGLPPTNINNTFSVDGKTVATAVAPIVNKIIGRGIRGNLMEVAR